MEFWNALTHVSALQWAPSMRLLRRVRCVPCALLHVVHLWLQSVSSCRPRLQEPGL